MAENGEPKPEESSKYNEASMQIMRLNNLWTRIEDCANKGELMRWQNLLDSIWRELFADTSHLKEPEKTIRMNKYLKLKVLVAASETRTEWNKALNERHEFLKQLQDDVGKGGIFIDGRDKDYE